MRSRLRSPMSKSMTAVFLPRLARPVAKLALVVVLPTPPLPEVTTTTFVTRTLSYLNMRSHGPEHEAFAAFVFGGQCDAHRAVAQAFEVHGLERAVNARNRNELGVEPRRDDACPLVAARAGGGAPA